MKLREAEVGLASGTGSQTLQVTGTGSYPLEWTSNGPGSNLEGGATRGGRSGSLLLDRGALFTLSKRK